MCDDQVGGSPTDPESGLSRRHFLGATAGIAAAAAALRRIPRLSLRSPKRAVTADGTSAYSMAMHIHSSFSEQSGSMDSQLFQAASNAVDVLWWTDHDARMDGIDYRRTVHFTSLTKEVGGPGEGGPWIWTKAESGPLTSVSGGGIVEKPCSPNDPVVGGSLSLIAKSSTTATAKYGYYADCYPAGWNYRDNLTGQSLTIDVLLDGGWKEGYLELLVATSHHEAAGGQPAGDYTLSYRFVPPGTPASRVANGIQGVITIPVIAPISETPWCTVTIAPSNDIAALWPDIDYRDFALFGLTLSAVSNSDRVAGHFDYLRFTRNISGEAFLEQQIDMGVTLASQYPSVVQRQGLEVSWQLPHVNWFGGAVVIPDYGSTTRATYPSYLLNTAVPQIHAAGGLVSYNHPYGYAERPALAPAQQDALLAQVATTLLPTATTPAALGADLLEVGYNLRQGVDLYHHLALWDVMSRNAVFLTGNGTSDDHFGQNWSGLRNNWVTSVWAASTAEADLLTSLAGGRSWCGSLSEYRGSLDLLVDGSCPMGSVSVSSATLRLLVASATGIAPGGSLQVLQGPVDYAGRAGLAANTELIGAYSATDLASGSIAQWIDNTGGSFIRTQVLNSAGAIVSVSNPIWLLRMPPPGGIPIQRAA
jgi:hypothetical protein